MRRKAWMLGVLGVGLAWLGTVFGGARALAADDADRASGQPKKYALLVGVDKYEHAEMNRPEPLKYAVADVSELAQLLKDSGYEVDLLDGPRATKKAIEAKLALIPEKGNADGVILVGLAGHGVQFENNEDAFYCPYDAKVREAVRDGRKVLDRGGRPILEPAPESCVKLTDIVDKFRLAPASTRVLLADCCRNDPATGRGRGVGSGIRTDRLPPNTAVLLSCSQGQRSWEDDKWKHGAFFYHVLKGLRDGEGTVARLNAYLESAVPEEVADLRGATPQVPYPLINGQRLDFGIVPNGLEELRAELEADAREYLRLPVAGGIAEAKRLAEEVDPSRFKRWSEGAERGWPAGQWLLGYASKDDAEAVMWYRRAADQGYATAQFSLGRMYDYGRGVRQDDAEAFDWYRKAADQGLANAQCNLGVMYENGQGVRQDHMEAVDWYRKAAGQGLAAAQYNLGVMYENGRGVPQDNAEAVSWYRKAAEQGDPDAQCNLGVLYDTGRGVPQDDAEAVTWFRKSAEQGHAAAQYNVGVMYANGRGVGQDDAEAVKWYRKSAEQGDADAQSNLGRMYDNGRGVPQDDVQAFHWYRKAAEQGLADAQCNLGVMHQNGQGVRPDDAEAVTWYRKAAEQGLAAAQYNLGVMYDNGRGVGQDDAEAFNWYRKAAEQGDPDAQCNLGVMYDNGRGVRQDEAEAVRWFRKSAEQGDADAQRNLGVMYANGRGVEQDDAEAVRWYRKSAEQGHAAAQSNLGAMLTEGRALPRDDDERNVVVTSESAEIKINQIVLARVKQGERFAVEKVQGDWYLVSLPQPSNDRTTGWIHRRSVRLEFTGGRKSDDRQPSELLSKP